MAGESAVLVAVRSRPLLESDESINPGLKFSEQDGEVAVHDKSFTFDYVFPPDCTNLHVYKTAVANRLEHIFNGYNLTIFAYGQTGSGKSHTMGTNCSSGEKAELGLIPQSVTDIFNEINDKGSNQFCVKASFLEVYKEEVYDLLNKKGESSVCSIREDGEGVKVTNLTEIPVGSVEDVLNVLRKGCNARRIGATALNEYSSRSHAIFALVIEQNCGNFDTKKSKFQLIDLAGSERAERSKTDGVRFKEGVDINKGLLALGKVISGLCGEKSHIPYRDSKLTRLLMDSLGGNSYTLMIGCISPSLLSSEETTSTLRYASRARKIKNKPVVNVDPPHIQIQKLKQQVELLQSQLYRKVTSVDSLSSIEDTSDIQQLNGKLKQELNSSNGKIAAISEELIKAEEKAGNLEGKMNSLCRDLRVYLLNHDSDEPSPALKKLFDHLKCLDLDDQDLLTQKPELVSCSSSESPEQETSDEDEDVANLKGDAIKQKLGNIELDLLKKQEIINHLETISKVVDLNECTQDDLNSMKAKIEELSQEKANLEEKLKASAKRITDECEKRYKECQCEINGLQKKIFKNELMHKVKAQHQMKMEKFQQEIKELKCTRVKLIKKMKTESEQFRKLQMAKERELAKLKQNERKKEREILVLRNSFDKQMNVFKQKMEKVQALNKRLNEAMGKRKGISLAKKQKVEKETVEEWLNKELDVELFSKLASEQYNFAKENMCTLAEKVELFQKAGDHSGSLQNLIDLELEKLDAAKPVIKCLPEKRTERWSTVSSMAEAKVTLEILFDKYVSSHVESYLQNEFRMSEVSSLKQKLEMKDKKAADETKNLNEKIVLLKEKLEEMKEDYECKLEKEKCHRDIAVIDCLKTMSDLDKDCAEQKTSSDLSNKIQVQDQEIQRLNERFAEYAKKCDEVEYWKEECKKLKHSRKRKRYLKDFPSQEQSTSSFTHEQETSSGSALYEYLEDVAEESFSGETDSKDPDWRMTPIGKQRKRPLRETVVLNTTTEQDDDTLPSKRAFWGCKCPGDCRTMRCACKKKMQACGTPCSCNKNVCMNISSEENV